MTFCGLHSFCGVLMIVIWTAVKSAVFPTIVIVCIELNQEIHDVSNTWILIYLNSKWYILIIWDILFMISITCKP